jgi:hypothetical protein
VSAQAGADEPGEDDEEEDDEEEEAPPPKKSKKEKEKAKGEVRNVHQRFRARCIVPSILSAVRLASQPRKQAN